MKAMLKARMAKLSKAKIKAKARMAKKSKAKIKAKKQEWQET